MPAASYLVAAMIPTDDERAAVEPVFAEAEPHVDSGTAAPDPTDMEATNDYESGASSEMQLAEPTPPAEEGEASSHGWLTSTERSFLSRVAEQVVLSPRRIKRLANSYRLVWALVSAAALSKFFGDENRPASFQAVIPELAVVVGSPLGAPHFFTALDPSRDVAELRRAIVDGSGLLRSDRDLILALLDLYLTRSDEREAFASLVRWSGATSRLSFTVRPRSL